MKRKTKMLHKAEESCNSLWEEMRACLFIDGMNPSKHLGQCALALKSHEHTVS